MSTPDPQTVLAIIRAVRPKFRNKYDRLAFAVHAFMLADGYKLVAVGSDAEGLEDVDPSAPEVGIDDWLDLDDSYAFAYADTTGKRRPVLVRALPVDDKLVVHILPLGAGAPPSTVELNINKYSTPSTDLVGGYKDLGDMLSRLEEALHASPAKEASPAMSQAPLPGIAAGQGSRPGDSLRDGPPEGLRALPTPGSGDLLPPGIPRDITGIPGISGGGPEPPGGGIGVPGGFPGGMHVGPHDPIFAGRSRTRPGFGLPEGPFPGARYDPVNPEGLQGFNARDFQRDRPTHPDIMPPGRDRGPDFDSMFG